MADYFFDSSGLVKRYVAESGTAWVIDKFKPRQRSEIAVSQISAVEVVSAITRRRRGGSLETDKSEKAIRRFLRDYHSRFAVVRVNDAIINEAVRLAQIHNLRGYDAVQLATALELKKRLQKSGLPPFEFISADNDLNTAANAEGLTVENPNNYP